MRCEKPVDWSGSPAASIGLPILPPLSEPDLATVAKSTLPQGVICLISALAFHELTTQDFLHEVVLALPRTAVYAKLKFPPLHVFHFPERPTWLASERSESTLCPSGVYSAEKTLADCFKVPQHDRFSDVAIQALRPMRSTSASA